MPRIVVSMDLTRISRGLGSLGMLAFLDRPRHSVDWCFLFSACKRSLGQPWVSVGTAVEYLGMLWKVFGVSFGGLLAITSDCWYLAVSWT